MGSTALLLHFSVSRDDAIMIMLPIVFLALGAVAPWIPLFARLVPPETGESVTVTRSFEEQVADYPEYEKEMKDLEAVAEWAEEVRDPARTPWHCTACDEDNPATFDVCWKCQKERPMAK